MVQSATLVAPSLLPLSVFGVSVCAGTERGTGLLGSSATATVSGS